MKNYKQILEAINKGIQLALDDFDDNDLIGQQTQTINDTHYTKEYLDLMNNYVVDLGLPSGTLWCKYNLGCDFNKLNKQPNQTKPKEWYGDYYCWGATEPITDKQIIYYEPFSIKQCPPHIDDTTLLYDGSTPQLMILQFEHDAAYQNMHGNYKFYIPTKEQIDELVRYTINKEVENYQNIIGLNGIEFTSIKNNETLFLPASGYYQGYELRESGEYTYAWSSTLNIHKRDHTMAYCLGNDLESFFGTLGPRPHHISCEIPIRPVIKL